MLEGLAAAQGVTLPLTLPLAERAVVSWGTVWARLNVDGMLGTMRLVLACGLYHGGGICMYNRYREYTQALSSGSY
jgi:hypothetical protein